MFDSIITHERPHFDEYLAIFLLKKFGENKFPGIRMASIVYWNYGDGNGERSVDDYEKEGMLFIGVGGGRFDEHSPIGGERKQGECAATLVAKALGIADDLSLEKILKFALNNDIKAASHPFDIAYITKVMHQKYPNDSDIVMNWVMTGLEAKYEEQNNFFNEAKKEFERMAKIENISGPRGVLRMVTIVSDDEQISKFARSAYGGNTAIVIQKKTSGNVQIYTDKRYGLVLYDVAQMLRLSEQKAKGKIATKDWKVLASDGAVAGAEEWHFHSVGQMLLNGSLTATRVPATKIPLEQIQEIVRIGINPNAFEPRFSSRCKRGICAVSLIKGDKCPWHEFGLQRCRKIRFGMRNS